MSHVLERRLEEALEGFVRDGVYKRLNYLDSPQAARVTMEGRGEVIILSSNNYLGLSNQPEVVAAAKAAQTKSIDEMFKVGGPLDVVCDNCHHLYPPAELTPTSPMKK